LKVLFVWPNKDSFGFKPLGLSLLSGIARRLGWDSRLFDTTEIDFGFADSTEFGESVKVYKPVDRARYGQVKRKLDLNHEFQKALKEYHPDCLAVSVLSDEVRIAARISQVAKETYPSLPIIWGGKYPTLNPELTLEKYAVDFACVGEGLDAFSDFLENLSQGSDLYNIRNIWAKKDEAIIRNSIRPLKANLDELPYVDWTIYDRHQFYKPFSGKMYVSGDHMLNWGCPYHCSYCINNFYKNLYNANGKYFMRRYGVRRIIDELKYLKEAYNLEFIKFHDEDFLLRPLENLRELSEAYRQEINIPFVIEINPKSVSREKVELLKNMNCVSVSMGIETGDNDLRRNLLKRVDSERDIIKAIALFKESDIRTVSFNMLGIPFESRETYRKTVELNRKANVHYPDVGFFYPFEGTELREVAIQEGLFNPADEETLIYQRDRPALNFNNLSETELVEMSRVFVLYIKLPRCYEPFIRRSETQDNLGRELRKKLLGIHDKTVWAHDGWYTDDGLQDVYLRELDELLSRQGQNKDDIEKLHSLDIKSTVDYTKGKISNIRKD